MTDYSKITALYSRLSVGDEDRDGGESNSIQNQKIFLENYARGQHLTNIRHYIDDDESGRFFDRSAYSRMMDDVENGKIGVCIMKDLTRWGRDYLQVGNAMEIFRRNNVRFIAGNNGIDSEKPDTLEFAPFINIMSEWYAKDISKKVKTGIKTKGMSGKPIVTEAPYGYVKDPDNKDFWIIDEEAAEVVRLIFRLFIGGKNRNQIAVYLTQEQIPTPTFYMKDRGRGTCKNKTLNEDNRCKWNKVTLTHILTRQEYCGDVVNFKTTKHFRDKRNHYIDRSQWHITENVHEPIISRSDFETVQRILENAPVRRPNGDGEIHPLSGLLFCKDCGAKMHIRIDYRNGGKRHVAYCSEYHKGKAKNPKCHSPHIMDADLLMQTIAEVLKKIEDYSISNRAEFEALVKKNLAMQQTDKTKKQQKRIPQITTRLEQIDKVLNKLYEDNALGTIPQDRYEQMSQKYSEEYYALKAELATLQEQLSAYENAGGRAQKFLKLTERHAAFTELTPAILNEFISRIEVHERDQKRARYAIQHISIYFNYIGNTWINPYMLVMGRNNETVKFLDARNEYVPSRIKGKRINLLNDEGITEIVKKYESGESCIEVSVSEMEECDYVLTPNRYVKVNDVDANLVRLGNMVKEVKRGITLSASDMDQMIMDNPSDIRCLLPSDITAGVVTAEKYFHGELRKPGKNEANRGDVLISKTGNPFRIAVADRSYLVVGNTYILNIDSSKYSPEYIKCYLSSEAGQKEIMKYASGATTPIISVANLSSIEIPVHDEATQKEMDKHAENILSAMEESYKQIKICEDEMNALFR